MFYSLVSACQHIHVLSLVFSSCVHGQLGDRERKKSHIHVIVVVYENAGYVRWHACIPQHHITHLNEA